VRWGARARAGRSLTYPTPSLLGAQRAALVEEHVTIDTAAGQVVEHESAGVKIGLPLGEQFSYFLRQSISVCVCGRACVRACGPVIAGCEWYPLQLGLVVAPHERSGRLGFVALGVARRLAAALLPAHRVPTVRLPVAHTTMASSPLLSSASSSSLSSSSVLHVDASDTREARE